MDKFTNTIRGVPSRLVAETPGRSREVPAFSELETASPSGNERFVDKRGFVRESAPFDTSRPSVAWGPLIGTWGAFPLLQIKRSQNVRPSPAGPSGTRHQKRQLASLGCFLLTLEHFLLYSRFPLARRTSRLAERNNQCQGIYATFVAIDNGADQSQALRRWNAQRSYIPAEQPYLGSE